MEGAGKLLKSRGVEYDAYARSRAFIQMRA